MDKQKHTLLFLVGELVILVISLYAGVFFVFPLTLNIFTFTSTSPLDFFTPALFALPLAIFLVAAPLSTIWFKLFKH